MIPLPSKWRIEFCDPIPTEPLRRGRGGTTAALVLELSERVRSTIQQKVYENLVERGGAFV